MAVAIKFHPKNIAYNSVHSYWRLATQLNSAYDDVHRYWGLATQLKSAYDDVHSYWRLATQLKTVVKANPWLQTKTGSISYSTIQNGPPGMTGTSYSGTNRNMISEDTRKIPPHLFVEIYIHYMNVGSQIVPQFILMKAFCGEGK